MRMTKGYWTWGLFSSKDRFFLNEIKAKVQSKLKSPFFETHITLTGPYLNIGNIFFIKLKNFDLANHFSQHISLSHGNHATKEKKELISNLPELNKPIKCQRLDWSK